MEKIYYKTVQKDLKSWHGNMQYEVGKEVSLPPCKHPELGSDAVLHASEIPLVSLIYADYLNCCVLEVKGQEVVRSSGRSGFFSLSVVREVPDSEKDSLFEFSYNEFLHPVNACDISVDISGEDKENLDKWISVINLVRYSDKEIILDSLSVREIVDDSIGLSKWKFLMRKDPVWNPLIDTVVNSIVDSIKNIVEEDYIIDAYSSDRIRISEPIWAYIGSLFPGIHRWIHFIDDGNGIKEYPFQSAVDLWKRGFVPLHVKDKWILFHPIKGKPAEIVWERPE